MTYDTKGQIVVCSKSEFKVTSLQGGNDMNYERARQLMVPPFLAFYQPLLSLSIIHSLLTIYHQNHDE